MLPHSLTKLRTIVGMRSLWILEVSAYFWPISWLHSVIANLQPEAMRRTQTGLQLIRGNVQPCQLQLMGQHHVSLTSSLTSLLRGLLDQTTEDLSRSLLALYV